MKFFSSLLTVVSVGLLSAVGTMAQTPDQVIGAIQMFITASQNLDTAVTGLNAINFPVEGFIIAEGFNNITSAVGAFNTEFLFFSAAKVPRAALATAPFPDPAAVEVVQVLTTFVQVHQALLNLVIGKESLAAMFGFTAPIAAALRSLEAVVDTFAFGLIALIPTEADPATTQVNALSVTFAQANAAYSS